MAMLAAPRRKQKMINLRAKNNEWSNDSTKFGQKMLEKMGWTSGKGLGAKENGIVEHVVAKYKNDDNGLGYEDKNDQWTKHEDDFNALLANLSNGSNSEEILHSGVSLEDKSKRSKARVHYHKFTRGKDLSRYSEKQLANIFGKKSLKKTESLKECDKEDIKASQVVFTEKGSMEDYFKNKMAAKITKNNTLQAPQTDNNQDEEADFAFKGFSGTNEDKDKPTQQEFGFQSFSLNNIDKKEEKTSESAEAKKDTVHKKKKKLKKQKEVQDEETEINNDNLDSVVENQPVKKNKKSKKHNQESLPEVLKETVMVNKKSKKKRKNKCPEAEDEVLPTEEVDESITHVPKKKKKRKRVDVS